MSKSRDKKNQSPTDQVRKKAPKDIDNAGNYLRTIRLGKGLSIKEVTEATRISETNINAIEDQDFSSLPADTFTRGLLNIYANFLDVDPGPVIVNFMEQRDAFVLQKKKRTRQKQPSNILSPKRLAEPTHISSMTMAVVLFLIIVVSFAGYCLYTSWNPFSYFIKDTEESQSSFIESPAGDQHIRPPVSEERITIVPAEKSSQTAAKIVQQLAEMKSDIQTARYSVTLLFLKDTRIEQIKDDDDSVTLEFKSGDSHSLLVNSSLQLTFSHADSAEILVNDTNVAFPESQDDKYTLIIPQDLAETPTDE